MADDVTMCPGGACPRREGCYRYRALASARQDWLVTPPFDPVTGTCSLYWDLDAMRPTDEAVRFRAYLTWQREGCPEGRADAHWAEARAALDAAFAARLRG
jgi:hypothetical protein